MPFTFTVADQGQGSALSSNPLARDDFAFEFTLASNDHLLAKPWRNNDEFRVRAMFKSKSELAGTMQRLRSNRGGRF